VTISNIQLLNDAGTYTAAAGSDRIVVITLAREGAGATPAISTLELGGCTLANGKIIQAATASKSAGAPRGTAYIWYIKEVDIAATLDGAARTLTGTWAQAMNGTVNQYVVYTLTGREQTNPIEASTSLVVDTATNPWTLGLTVAQASDVFMCGWTSATGVSPAAPSPWVEDLDSPDTDYKSWAGHVDSATSGLLDCTLSLGANRSGSVVVASFASAPAWSGGEGGTSGSLLNSGLN
jgi:hypothetical protein